MGFLKPEYEHSTAVFQKGFSSSSLLYCHIYLQVISVKFLHTFGHLYNINIDDREICIKEEEHLKSINKLILKVS